MVRIEEQDRSNITPTCGTEKVMGFWQAEGKNKIRVWFESQKRESYTQSIVSFDKNMLMIKQRRQDLIFCFFKYSFFNYNVVKFLAFHTL